MKGLYQRFLLALDQPLTGYSRLLTVFAALALVPTFFIPLWHMSFYAQQYPEGLELYIYTHDLVGGDDGNDLTEINVLNHYIGMAELDPDDFPELTWMPLVIGLILALALRAGTIGNLRALIDTLVGTLYFGAFSLWSFWYKLESYGRNLDPRASVQVEPFMPPIFGYKLVGQFDVWSYPAAGAYFFALYGLFLAGGLWLTWRSVEKPALLPG